jgi:hypothetical protein
MIDRGTFPLPDSLEALAKIGGDGRCHRFHPPKRTAAAAVRSSSERHQGRRVALASTARKGYHAAKGESGQHGQAVRRAVRKGWIT